VVGDVRSASHFALYRAYEVAYNLTVIEAGCASKVPASARHNGARFIQGNRGYEWLGSRISARPATAGLGIAPRARTVRGNKAASGRCSGDDRDENVVDGRGNERARASGAAGCTANSREESPLPNLHKFPFLSGHGVLRAMGQLHQSHALPFDAALA